jgi:acetyltransferase-like isoleucine patch superfamily enzyme
MSSIASTAKVYPNVRLGADVQIGPWAVVGRPPAGIAQGELETFIGDGSNIRSHSVVYAGSRTGPRFQTGHHAIVGPGMDIGNRCSIGTSSFVSGFVRLGSGARIHGHTYVGDFAWIEEKAWVGPYNILESSFDRISAVGSGAILALGVHLLAGIRIGDRALVGMRSLITNDIPPYRVVVGNPPRAIRTIDQIVSPIPEVGRPYEADPPEMQEAALTRHAARHGCLLSDDDWRRDVWQTVTAARANNHDPDWHLVPAYEPKIAECVPASIAK